jgi:23S rRNA pseudouridine955/2504/2580 synthase
MQEFTITETDAGLRLDQWCKRHIPQVPYMLAQKLIRTGGIKVDKRKTDAKARLDAGQTIAIYAALDQDAAAADAPKAAPAPQQASKKKQAEIRRWVIYETKDCIVLNKPPGIAAQGGSGIRDSVDGRLDGLRETPEAERPRLAHRIDRDTSGILLLGKTRAFASRLTEAFRSKQARKLYWALVIGVPDQPIGSIDIPLGKRAHAGGKEKMSVVEDEDGQDALTHYRVVQSFGGRLSWLELMPVTGRTHQLRVHLQAIGNPIYGDGKYAGQGAFVAQPPLERQLHLHARYLEIAGMSPRLQVTAPLPEHMMASWDMLGFHFEDDGVSLLELL